MKKTNLMIMALMLAGMSTNVMAQTNDSTFTSVTNVIVTQSEPDKTCQEWMRQFEKEVTDLKADISSTQAKLAADKKNENLKIQLKQKKDDLKVAQQNLKLAKQAVKNEAAAEKEVLKAKAQVNKLQSQKDKANSAVAKAEQKVVKAEQGVTKAEQKVAAAEQGVAKAQQKVEAAKQNVTKAKDVVNKAKDDVAKAKSVVANVDNNTDVNANAIKAAQEKKLSALKNLRKSIIIRANGSSGH